MISVTADRDARSLDHKTLEEMRRLSVQRVLAGEKQVDVARSLRVHDRTVQKWMRMHRRGGEAAIASRKATGRPPTLSKKEAARLRRTITGKNPAQLNLGPALWTLPLVGQLIERMFDVTLDPTTVGRILRRLGFTPQRPLRQAFQRDDAECRAWATKDFTLVVREAKRKQATLLFLDEAAVHEDGPVGSTWALRGSRPVVKVTGSRRRTNVISAISPRGRMWFRCYGGTLNAERFEAFLVDLLASVKGRIVLVLDRHPAHRAGRIQRFLRKHRARITIHFLPSYAPDLNPDEHVWSYLKGLFRQDPLAKDEDLIEAVNSQMNHVQSDPALVRAFFDHPAVAYVKHALKW
jgi:transposase